MPERSLFVTGGTGFIGRRLLSRLGEDRSFRVRCLTRDRSRASDVPPGTEVVVGDLRDAPTYIDALGGCEMVVHLAAVTGKARPEEYFAVNDTGTRALLDACRGAGVRRVIFVSSIAATFHDKTAYDYAVSKQRAEQAVRDSGLNYLILRPTIVLGEGSPVLNRLVALASLPIVPVIGTGQVLVQPVHVDDVVAFLMSTIGQALPDRAIDLGGPDVVTLEDLVRRIRRRLRGSDAPVVHLPARRVIALLQWAERRLPPVLPIAAGQLAAFINDSIEREGPSPSQTFRMSTIDEMLRQLVGHG